MYKDEIQNIADELAEGLHDKPFDELDIATKMAVYAEANKMYIDQICDLDEGRGRR